MNSKKDINFDFEAYKDRLIVTLSCGEYCALSRYANALVSDGGGTTPLAARQAVGIAALADALSCSPSQVAAMRRDGALDCAIISQVGRRIVFNIDQARSAANEWKKNKKPAGRQAS